MRVTAIVVGICMAVASARTTFVSAQTEQRKPVGTAGAPVQGGTMAPPATPGKPMGPTRPVKTPGKMTATPLTASECSALGGKVWTAQAAGICNSGKYCETTDQNGAKHAACITAR